VHTETVVDISDVLHGFDLMRARASDLSLVFRDLREYLKDEIARHFKEAEGPSGAWAPRAASTEARARFEMLNAPKRRGKGRAAAVGPMLRLRRSAKDRTRLLGRFRAVGAYLIKTTSTSLTMYPRGPWAAVHQYGGTVGHGSHIPARPFLWVSDRVVRRFEEALHLHIMSGWLR
jgi:phage gpG-like protein